MGALQAVNRLNNVLKNANVVNQNLQFQSAVNLPSKVLAQSVQNTNESGGEIRNVEERRITEVKSTTKIDFGARANLRGTIKTK